LRVVIRGVVFDRDGVLTAFDYAPVLALVRDLPIDLGELRRRWEAFYRAEPAARTVVDEHALIARFWTGLCEAYGASAAVREAVARFDYTAIFRAYPDARPALLAARARGLRIGVLSNFPLVRIDASLAAAGLGDLVDSAVAASAIGAIKPAPAAYHHVLATLGVAPEECVLVDDEAPCVAGACAVGIKGLRLDRGASAADVGGGVLRDLHEFGAVLDALGAQAAGRAAVPVAEAHPLATK
jgi:HAD superfamily hydrolase (TIGR01509 family)